MPTMARRLANGELGKLTLPLSRSYFLSLNSVGHFFQNISTYPNQLNLLMISSARIMNSEQAEKYLLILINMFHCRVQYCVRPAATSKV
jgi:hypothetical protein